MSLIKSVGLFAGAAALSLTGAALAETGNSDNEDLRAKVAELEAKIARMEAANSGNWMSEQRADEIRSLVRDVIADADTRASLLGSNGFGYNNGRLGFASQDGTMSAEISGQMQFRGVFNNVDDDDVFNEDSTRWGFENTRTKLVLEGNVHEFMYRIQGNFARFGGAELLEDAWIGWSTEGGWNFYGGQFKPPVSREALVDSMYQLTVERTFQSAPFAVRTQGLLASYEAENWRFKGSYNDGVGTANTPWSFEDTEFAVSGRGEFLFDGAFDQFDDFTSMPGGAPGIMAGVGGHYQNGEAGTSTTQLEFFAATADISLEFDGANVFGAVLYTDLEDTIETLGFVVQGGVFLNENWEAFARYEYLDFDVDALDESESASIITLGVNDYIHGHDAKFTADVGYAFDEIFAASDITGFRTSSEDGQWVIRTQLQLLF